MSKKELVERSVGYERETPLWALQFIARELGIPEVVVRNAPRAVDLINQFRGYYSDIPSENRGTKRKPAVQIPDIPKPNPKKRTQNPSSSSKIDPMEYGYYQGKFKKPKKFKQYPNGISSQRTSGGVATAGDRRWAVHVGFSPVTSNNMRYEVFLSVLRKLSQKLGMPFVTYNDRINLETSSAGADMGSFHYVFSYDSSNAVQERVITITDGQTWWELAVGWWNNINSFFSSAQTFQLKRCMLYGRTEIGQDTVLMPVAAMNCQNLTLHYSLVSTVTIQNRTGASTDTDDSTEVNDVNPVKGKIFVLKGSSAELRDNNDNLAPVPIPPVINYNGKPDPGTGVIDFDISNWNDSGMRNNFALVPPNNVWKRCMSASSVALDPGAMKTNTVKKEGSMKLDDFITSQLMMEVEAGGRIGNQMPSFGVIQVFSMRKACTTNEGSALAKLGYNHRQFHWFDVSYPKRKGFITFVNGAD